MAQSVDKPQSLFLRRLRRIFVFPLTCAAKKHLISEKSLISDFSRAQGWYWRSITTACRLWRIKGGCYGAAVKENSRSKRIFSLGTARVGSAVRKSLIFERAAFPPKSVAIFRHAQAPSERQRRCLISNIFCALRLQLFKLVKSALFRHKLLVCTVFHTSAAVHNGDFIGIFYGG